MSKAPMDETTYYRHAEAAFRRVEAALEAFDADEVDFDRAGDVLRVTFRNGGKCVLNTQRPTRQLWLAADAHAWHYSLDAGGAWRDDHGDDVDLFARVAEIVGRNVGRPTAV